MGRRIADGPGRKQQPFAPAIAYHAAGCPYLFELAEDQIQSGLYLFVWILDDVAMG